MYALLAFHEAHKMKPLSSPYAGLSTLRYPAGCGVALSASQAGAGTSGRAPGVPHQFMHHHYLQACFLKARAPVGSA